MIVLHSGEKKPFILDVMMSPGISSNKSQNVRKNPEIPSIETFVKNLQLWVES